MDKLVIEGGKRLKGEVVISGAKNAALPIMAATLLTDQTCVVRRIPRLRDVATMAKLLRSLGKQVEVNGDAVTVSSKGPLSEVAHYDLVSKMRGSFCVLGPLLTKLKKARVSIPGGCIIGTRPVDLHLKGLQALGARIDIANGYVVAQAKKLRGTQIYLGGAFGSSVLATANVMMAATLAAGETVIESAACEPEIEDLANFLIAMGADVSGHGSPRIMVRGVKELGGVSDYTVIPDRIEAGTFLLLAAATKSDLTIKGARSNHLLALIDKVREAGIKISHDHDTLTVAPSHVRPVSVATYPYPGLPTDLQAQFMALMAITPGVSVVTEKVYPDRFIHVAELNRMGAQIRRDNNIAVVQGVKTLFGAPVMASDLRASAALVIAGLAAKGTTEIHRMYHLERGYEAFDEKLTALGAMVRREKE